MILLAFIASWTVCFLLGFLLRGLLEAEHQRRIRYRPPDHPTLRNEARLRLVEPPPYDWKREQEA